MLGRIWKLITLTFAIWNKANASRMAAALTYYTMLSLAPTLMIAVAIAGYVYDNELAQAEVIEQVGRFTTPEIAKTVAKLVKNAVTPGSGAIAGVISLSILLFAASGVFTQLYDTFNDIWNVSTEKYTYLFTLQKRLLGIGMVLIVGLLLIGALILNSITAYLTQWAAVSHPRVETWLSLADRSLTYLLMPVGFGMMFWFFPSTKVQLRDVWPAAILTAVMVGGGRYLIGIYMKFSTTSEVYGVSGSLVVLLIWVYMMGIVVFFGASFSHAWAQVFGSRSEFAVAKSEHSEVQTEIATTVESATTVQNENKKVVKAKESLAIQPVPDQEKTSSISSEKTNPIVPQRRS